MSRSLVALLAVVAMLAGACGAADDASSADGPRVVATTAVLGDLVDTWPLQPGALSVLMDGGEDPHAFQPSAQDVQLVNDADLVIANGLGLEAGLEQILEAAEANGVRVLRVAEFADPREYAGDAHEDDGDHDDEAGHDDEGDHDDEAHNEDDGHGHGALDPHFWLDPVRVAGVAGIVARALVDEGLLPADGTGMAQELVEQTYTDLHRQMEARLAEVPEACRVLVTNHDALGYFADRYGFEVVGTVIPGSSSQAEPSARDLAELVEVIRAEGVPAIFAETTESRAVAESVASEVGGVEVVEIRVTPTRWEPRPDDGTTGAPRGDGTTLVGVLRDLAEAVATNLADC